ncbi:MAG: hypothetical protein WAW85_04525, partial [Gordonia sp. (in: high G+C Gram-positive bacteria)]|uniref:YncE family protein n=1 Tax=Gordonia sp. (in: high G+C Gram-positive bacteria) TaxID=84139 RepID=UPI003BB67842
GDVPTVAPATPTVSPPQSAAPIGTVIASPGGTALAQSRSTLAVLGDDGVVRLHTAPGAADTSPPRVVDLPGVTAVIADGDGFLAVSPTQVSRIATDSTVRRVAGDQGAAISVAVRGDQILVGTSDGHLRVLSASGQLQRDIYEFVRVDQILVAPATSDLDGQVVVLDRAQSLVAPVNIDTGERLAALRAGSGATLAVDDSYGRILVANTRDNEVLGFYGQPIVMRFRFPVAASPYAITWDVAQKRLWVSTTGDNQAIAYDASTGELRELTRIPTVGQVGAMATDPANGMLYLISQRGDGLQVVPSALTATAR